MYSSSTSDSVTLTLFHSPDDGGSAIIQYVLEYTTLYLNNWQVDTSYNGYDMVHVLTDANGEIVSH